jgi:hypothetical protein
MRKGAEGAAGVFFMLESFLSDKEYQIRTILVKRRREMYKIRKENL